MRSLSPALAGISYDRLEEEGGIQWPCPTPDHPGTRYLYETDFPRGPRAKFVAFDQGPAADEPPSERFPLILNTGRVLYHWHGGTITRRADNLLARSPELTVSMHPTDGDKYAIPDGEWIRVRSRRGDLEGRAHYTERQRAGELFVPFVKLQEHAANFLTNSALGPRLPHPRIQNLRRPHGQTPRRPRRHPPPPSCEGVVLPRGRRQDNRIGEDRHGNRNSHS